MRPLRHALLASTLLPAALLLPAAAGAEPCTEAPRVCVATSDTPERISVAGAGSTTYVQYRTTVTNEARSTITNVVLEDVLPSGTSLRSVSPVGCVGAAGVTTCDLGSLASGAAATVTVEVTGPAAAGTLENRVQVSFDEGPSDSPPDDPKQDTIAAVERTDVTATAGEAETWVPAGATTEISTDPTGANVATASEPQVAGARIQAAGFGVVALLRTDQPGPFTCPKQQVCRAGGWVQAQALIGGLPGVFDPPLRFALRWDATLVSKRQTVRNLAVFYSAELDGSAPQVISRRCGASSPPPCLDAVTEQADGDFTAVLVQHHNGYMR